MTTVRPVRKLRKRFLAISTALETKAVTTLRVALLSPGMMSTTTASIVAAVLLSSSFGFYPTVAAGRGLENAPPLSGSPNSRNRGVSTSGKRHSGEHHGGRTHKNVINRKNRSGIASKRKSPPGFLLASLNKIVRNTPARVETQDDASTVTAATQTAITSTKGAASTTATTATATNSRIVFFPGGGRGCSRIVPYLVVPKGGGIPRTDGASSAFVVNRVGVLVTEIRGGGRGGHPWFTGYSDTEEDEDSEYETEEGSEEGSEEPREYSETRGDAEEFGAEVTAGGVDKDGGDLSVVEAKQKAESTQREEKEENEGDGDAISTEDGPWGARNPAYSSEQLKSDGRHAESKEGGPEVVEDALPCDTIASSSSNGNGRDTDGKSSRDRESSRKKKNGTGDSSSSKKQVDLEDLYARTVARRVAMMATFAAVRRAVLRLAFLLVAFQMLPWLKYNPLARWLLGLSLLLQTMNELFRALSGGAGAGNRGRGTAGVGESDEASSKGAGVPGSNPRVGLVGGLLRAMSPEQEQHLEFVRLNDYFERDVEALRASTRSKAETAALLMEGAAQDSRMFGTSVMRAFMGLGGPVGSKATESSVTSEDKKTKKKRQRSRKKHRDTLEDDITGGERGVEQDSSCDSKGSNSTSIVPDAAGSNSTGLAEVGEVRKGRLFVVKFGGGKATTLDDPMHLLLETASFLVAHGNKTTDEMVLCLESGGGEVTQFGLLAATLARVKSSGIRLTVCVDKIAASGGYMMACVADWLVVAPFAMLGSIGVLGGIPNFNKALKRAGVEYYHFTAGDNKSLVGPFQEVTKAQQDKQQRQLDVIHSAFKRHIQRYRPAVDIDFVGTGDVWLGLEAVELKLADEVGTGGEYLHRRMSDSDVFLVKPHQKKAMKGVSAIFRQLLLGPLASAARFNSSLVTLTRTFEQLASVAAGAAGDDFGSFPGGNRFLRTFRGIHGEAAAAAAAARGSRSLHPAGIFSSGTGGEAGGDEPDSKFGLFRGVFGIADPADTKSPPASGVFAVSDVLGGSCNVMGLACPSECDR